MYEEIFNQIRSAANKRNLKDSTIHGSKKAAQHDFYHGDRVAAYSCSNQSAIL